MAKKKAAVAAKRFEGVPNSLDELLVYLKDNPRLYCRHPVHGQSGWRTFTMIGATGGPGTPNGIQFLRDDGGSAGIPMVVTAPGAEPPFMMRFEQNCFRLDVGKTGGGAGVYWYDDKILMGVPLGERKPDELIPNVVEKVGIEPQVVETPVGLELCFKGVPRDKTAKLDEWVEANGLKAYLRVLEGEQPEVEMYVPRAAKPINFFKDVE